jgi:hypothetical protein
MELHIFAQGKNDPPPTTFPQPIIDLSENPAMTVIVMEGGMQSGEPAVMILSCDEEGTVAIQTSLDKFMTAASTMAALAETHWGWARPEGHFTMMPPDRATQKKMLEAIRKELEEWEDIDDPA